MEDLLTQFVSPGTALTIIAGLLFFERLGKMIPDDATGILGAIRKLSKILGAYIENKK